MYFIVETDAWDFIADYIGPFDSEDDAIGYGEENFDNFTVCKLTLP